MSVPAQVLRGVTVADSESLELFPNAMPKLSFRRQDSSAFEHVFVGEAKQTEVLGMHNWITFCLQEKNGIFDYYGHSQPVRIF